MNSMMFVGILGFVVLITFTMLAGMMREGENPDVRYILVPTQSEESATTAGSWIISVALITFLIGILSGGITII